MGVMKGNFRAFSFTAIILLIVAFGLSGQLFIKRTLLVIKKWHDPLKRMMPFLSEI
jgi:hypothetical protein